MTSCVRNSDLEDYEKYAATDSPPPPTLPHSSLTNQDTALIEVCPYLSLGTNDTVSYKESIKVCIKEITLHITTDGKETSRQLTMDARYGDTEGLVLWEDIPEGITHLPIGVLADSVEYMYSWGCEAMAEIRFKVRMRDNDSSTGWSEWEQEKKSKICFPNQETHILNITVPIQMGAISFDAEVTEEEDVLVK